MEATIVAAPGQTHGLGSTAMQETLPREKSVFQGLRVWASTSIAQERCWSEVPCPRAGVDVTFAAMGTLPAETPVSTTRPVFVALFA